MPVLYLLRHATAETFAADFRDHSRRLTDVGREQVARVREALAPMSPQPRKVLVSTAMRTRQTAEGLRLGADLWYRDSLYESSMLSLSDELAAVPDDVESVLLVGHAPGVPTLAHALSDPTTSDPTALARLEQGYPTATLCRIELDGSWGDIYGARGRLTEVVWS